jgi:hypothetical protein
MLGGLSAIDTRPGIRMCLLTLASLRGGFHASAADDLLSGPAEATPAHAAAGASDVARTMVPGPGCRPSLVVVPGPSAVREPPGTA